MEKDYFYIPPEILEKERWRHVIGYKGIYEVSSAGRIRNAINGNIKQPTPDADDYLKVMLHKNGIRRNLRVHLLVGRAWKRNPHKKKEINHKNKVRWNNWIENLEWSTRSENMIHCFKFKNNQIKHTGPA